MTPSSGARSGTRPSRNDGRGAGDGSIGRKTALECGHGAPVEQQPLAVSAGVRWFVCPYGCSGLQKAKR